MIDVSIIIVNWNTKDILQNCLASIFAHGGDVELEVIVIDNASHDNSVSMVQTEFPQVILIENSYNKGFASANNQGIAIAKGRYLLLLNSDTIVLNDAIIKSVNFADSNSECGIVGCQILNPDRTMQQSCFMFPSILNMLLSVTYLYKIFPRNRFLGRERMSWWDRNDIREVDVVTGCFMLVRRQALDQVGLMDESFFVYGEETDWCYRFKQANWKILFTPDAQIIHFGRQSSKKIATQMALQLRGSLLQFFKKHHSVYVYRIACLLTLIFFVVRIPVWFLRWCMSKQNRAYCWSRMNVYIIGFWRLLCGGAQSLCTRPYKS